jgi:hypothetical protein
MINKIFNINKLRLPLFMLINVLNINKAFLVVFSFYLSKSAESISFMWESLKIEYFINGVLLHHIIISDWVKGLIISVLII